MWWRVGERQNYHSVTFSRMLSEALAVEVGAAAAAAAAAKEKPGLPEDEGAAVVVPLAPAATAAATAAELPRAEGAVGPDEPTAARGAAATVAEVPAVKPCWLPCVVREAFASQDGLGTARPFHVMP